MSAWERQAQIQQTRPKLRPVDADRTRTYLTFGPVTHWHAIWFPVALAASAFSLTAVALILYRLDLRYPDQIAPSIMRFFDLNGEANLPAWFASSLWLISALLAFAVWQKHRENGFPNAIFWIVMVPLFMFLSLDEAGTVHEAIGGALSESFDTYGYTYHWVAYGLALIGVVGLANLRFLIRLRPVYAGLFLLSAAVFISGAVGIESIAAAVELGQLEQMPLGQSWPRMIAYEETVEMIGVVLLIYTLLRILADPVTPYRTRDLPA